MNPIWSYRAKLQRVVDGDTVYLIVDLGMRVQTTVAIRVAGVDTPELFSGPPEEREAGAAARDETRRWFRRAYHDTEPSATVWPGHGEWPVLVTTKRDRTSFNRYIGTIHNRAGESLTDHLRQWMADQQETT